MNSTTDPTKSLSKIIESIILQFFAYAFGFLSRSRGFCFYQLEIETMCKGGSKGGQGRFSPDKGIRVGSGHSSPSRYSLARTPPSISVSLTRTKRNATLGNIASRKQKKCRCNRCDTNDDVSIFVSRIADITCAEIFHVIRLVIAKIISVFRELFSILIKSTVCKQSSLNSLGANDR